MEEDVFDVSQAFMIAIGGIEEISASCGCFNGSYKQN